MKIKLAVSKQRYKEVENTLTQCGLEIDDDADFTLSENNRYIDRLLVRDTVSDERVYAPACRRSGKQAASHDGQRIFRNCLYSHRR